MFERAVAKNVHSNCHGLDLCPLGRAAHPGRPPIRVGSAFAGLACWTRTSGIHLRSGILPSAESSARAPA